MIGRYWDVKVLPDGGSRIFWYAVDETPAVSLTTRKVEAAVASKRIELEVLSLNPVAAKVDDEVVFLDGVMGIAE